MKQVGRRYGIALLIGFLWMLLGLFTAWNAVAEMHATGAADTGNLENIILNRAKGKERVTFVATRISTFKVDEEAGNAVLLKLENLSAPEILRRPFSDEAMINVLQVVAEQKTVQGKPWVHAAVYLKQPVPYSVRQEGQNVILDFNVASWAKAATPSMEKKTAPEASSGHSPENQRITASENRKQRKPLLQMSPPRPGNTAKKISLDFQMPIFELFSSPAETVGVSIVPAPMQMGPSTFT
jgi:type IV pilus assembly protein PilQ